MDIPPATESSLVNPLQCTVFPHRLASSVSTVYTRMPVPCVTMRCEVYYRSGALLCPVLAGPEYATTMASARVETW